MSYPFVQATADYGPRKGPVRAFVIHMAEGGGTVGFLSNPTVPRGVSVHYVIESAGRIVQMLREDHASGSINPTEIRNDDDPDGFYGATAAKAVMGAWWGDPNSAVISCEVEGFAAVGPNASQHGSLRTLVADVRQRHGPIALLGHRDFQNYKACPGKLVHWDMLGGHGYPIGEPMGLSITFPAGPIVTGTLAIPKGADAIRVSDRAHYTVPDIAVRQAAQVALTGSNSGGGYLVDLNGDEAHFIRANVGVFTPAGPVVDCDDVVTIELGKAADRAAVAVRTRA